MKWITRVTECVEMQRSLSVILLQIGSVIIPVTDPMDGQGMELIEVIRVEMSKDG